MKGPLSLGIVRPPSTRRHVQSDANASEDGFQPKSRANIDSHLTVPGPNHAYFGIKDVRSRRAYLPILSLSVRSRQSRTAINQKGEKGIQQHVVNASDVDK